MAKKENAEETNTMAENEPKMVKVRLHMGDRAETKMPLECWINGREYVVPRGKEVEVPDYVAALIQDSEDARVEEMEFNAANENVHYHY